MKLTVQLVDQKDDSIIREESMEIPTIERIPLVVRVMFDDASKKSLTTKCNDYVKFARKVFINSLIYLMDALMNPKTIAIEISASEILED